MPPGGRSNPGNVVDGDVLPRRPRSRILSRRSTEKTNPSNLAFNRKVAVYQAKKEQERQNQMSAFLGNCYRACLPYWNIVSNDGVEDGEDGESLVPWKDVLDTSAPLLLKAGTQQGEEQLPKDSAKLPDDSDFLEGTFIKINSDKQKSTRNKKSSKKKGKGRKQSHASGIKSPSPKPASTCADTVSGEVPVSSSSHSSSSSSPEIPINHVIISGACSEKELSSSSKDNDFNSFDSTTSYSTAASSSANDYTSGDYAHSLLDVTSEWSLSASECIDSRGFIKKKSGEGSKPNVHQSFSLAVGGSQEGSLCRDYASINGDFQKVISRKAAQKMKKMQRLESPTMSASGPTATRALVSTAPTIGDYIKDDSFYVRKPNHKTKGKNQKGPSMSNVSKTGFTDGENVPVSSRMLLIPVHKGKPGSSQMALSSTSRHDVSLEDIQEASSTECLPMEGELEAPVGGDAEDKDSTAPSSDKTSSLGNPANSSCVDREEQKKAIAPVAVGGGTENTDSTAPSSDKLSLDHLDNSPCVDRNEQKKAMAPIAGDSENKDTDSLAPSSDDHKTSSLGHLSNSSRVDREEQKKGKNEQAFSTHASSQLDKIIKAANDAYKIQAESDTYMIYGVHADIETFLHSATPVIAQQISSTTNNISLQDQCLWCVWRWYEEPECYGIEVDMQGSITSSWANSSTYFVPSLSAVQLFGQSGNKFGTPEEPLLSPNHGRLLFEYFESEMPFQRPPLLTKIKQLLNGVNLSGNPIFGDPKQLKSVKLSDLDPSSWFCVSWYPICQIPSAARTRSCQAAFLTYHSLGKLVSQTYATDMANGLHRIICPIVGLLGYKDQGENWYQLGEQPRSQPTPNGSWKTHPAELLNKKMRALRHCASTMSKAVNYHPDYEFFWSRSQYYK